MNQNKFLFRFSRVIAFSLSVTFLLILIGCKSQPKEIIPFSPTATPTSEQPQKMYTNPLGPEDFPDPYLLRDGNKIYVYSSVTSGYNIPVMVMGKDWTDWRFKGDSLPDPPSWSPMGVTWAPAVIKIGERYIMYVSTGHRELKTMCTSIVVADDPLGPFKDILGKPLICRSDCGQIDASPFVDPKTGKLYLYWQADGEGCPIKGWIMGSELAPSGLELVGESVQLIHNDQSWETPRVEAPSMFLHKNGKYYLLYSGADWFKDTYAIGYALCDAPLGTCKKPQNEPLVAKTDQVAGPGGQEWFVDSDGNPWIVYHGWTPPDIGYEMGGRRSLRIDPVFFLGDSLVIEAPSVTPKPQPK